MFFAETRTWLTELGVPGTDPDTNTLVSGRTFSDGCHWRFEVGYRLRGQEQLVRALEDVRRAVDVGVRGFILHDEGLLSVLGRLRAAGKIPEDTHLKISAHCGLGNGAAAQVLEGSAPTASTRYAI